MSDRNDDNFDELMGMSDDEPRQHFESKADASHNDLIKLAEMTEEAERRGIPVPPINPGMGAIFDEMIKDKLFDKDAPLSQKIREAAFQLWKMQCQLGDAIAEHREEMNLEPMKFDMAPEVYDQLRDKASALGMSPKQLLEKLLKESLEDESSDGI